jgi:hypothetical protein
MDNGEHANIVRWMDQTGGIIARVFIFAAGNALLFTVFSVLWVRQYHMSADLSDMIDHIVVPWLWLACFFIASFLPLRRPKVIAIPIAAISAVAFSGILYLFIHIVLAPFYDPMF